MLSKVFKSLLIVIISILFTVLLIFLQWNLLLHNTVFSGKYFDRTFNENVTSEELEGLVQGAMESMASIKPADLEPGEASEAEASQEESYEVQQMIASYQKTLYDELDVKGFTSQIPEFVKGAYAYLISAQDSLPNINISPIKTSVIKIYASSILIHSNPDIGTEIKEIFQQINTARDHIIIDGNVNEQLVDELLKTDQFQSIGIDREAVKNVLKAVADIPGTEFTEQDLLQILIAEILGEKTGIQDMRDDLDVNVLLRTMYGSDENPVSGIRTLVSDIRPQIFFINILLVFLLFGAAALIIFKPNGLLRWSGINLVLSGAGMIILTKVAGVGQSLIDQYLNGPLNKLDGFDLVFFRQWISTYIQGILRFAFTGGIILLCIGLICVIVSIAISFKKSKYGQQVLEAATLDQSARHKPVKVIRIILVIILLVALPVCVISFSNNIRSRINQYREVCTNAESYKATIASTEILDQVLGTEFFSTTLNSK